MRYYSKKHSFPTNKIVPFPLISCALSEVLEFCPELTHSFTLSVTFFPAILLLSKAAPSGSTDMFTSLWSQRPLPSSHVTDLLLCLQGLSLSSLSFVVCVTALSG